MKPLKWIRRTIQIKSTFYVAMPLTWAEANNLKRYGEVSIELMDDGSLRITPRGQK
jgi:hypothetical protein